MAKTRKYRRKFGGSDDEDAAAQGSSDAPAATPDMDMPWDAEDFVLAPLQTAAATPAAPAEEEEEFKGKEGINPMVEDKRMKTNLQTWDNKEDNNKN